MFDRGVLKFLWCFIAVTVSAFPWSWKQSCRILDRKKCGNLTPIVYYAFNVNNAEGSAPFTGEDTMQRGNVDVELSEETPCVPIRGEEWARARGMEPGYGGYWPGDPNAPTHKVSFVSNTTGEVIASLDVPRDRYIFFYFEEKGVNLPIVNKPRMCRQGCCTVCTGKVLEGKVKMDSPLGLLRDMRKQGYILTCTSYPRSDLVIELQDEDEMYIKQWGEHFEGGGVEWGGVLPDDD